MAHGRLPGSASKLHATASPPSRGRGCIRFASFSGFTVISIWWVSSKGKWKSKKTEQWLGSVPHLPNSHCQSFLLKKSTPWQNPRCPKSKFLAVERDKVLPRCPKSTLSKIRRCQKKKSKFGGNLTRSGVRVRGLGLVWTSALTRSDRDQGQTRSRTRHRNLTRLVSHVLLTSLMFQGPLTSSMVVLAGLPGWQKMWRSAKGKVDGKGKEEEGERRKGNGKWSVGSNRKNHNAPAGTSTNSAAALLLSHRDRQHHKLVCSKFFSALPPLQSKVDFYDRAHYVTVSSGSHIGLPPRSIHEMTRLGGQMVWTITYCMRPGISWCLCMQSWSLNQSLL